MQGHVRSDGIQCVCGGGGVKAEEVFRVELLVYALSFLRCLSRPLEKGYVWSVRMQQLCFCSQVLLCPFLQGSGVAWKKGEEQSPPPPLLPFSRTADPGVVKQDKSSRSSVDTTKTPWGPQRVRMSSGERPIGAAKGKQSDTRPCANSPPLSPSQSQKVMLDQHGEEVRKSHQ